MMLTRPPDVVIADIGRFVAVRSSAGHYFALAGHGEQIAASFLAEDTGEPLTPWPSTATTAAGLDCVGELCRYAARGRRVAIVTGREALPLDCGAYDAIVAQVPAGFRCRATIPVIDRIDSWRRGAVALWLDPTGVAVESANQSRGDRPWVPHPRPHRVWYQPHNG
jgi:competence protein ComEC